MKKQFATIGSLIFMFSLYFVAIGLMSAYLNLSFLWILLIVEVMCILWSFVVMLNKKRRIETRIRWMFFIIFVPIIGIGSYFFFGRVYHYKTNKNYIYKNFNDSKIKSRTQIFDEVLPIMNQDIPEYKRSFMMGLNEQADIIYNNTHTEFLKNGNIAWKNILNDMNEAKEYILINMYIVAKGELFSNFTEIIKNKIIEGVRVYLIYDFIGSYGKLDNKNIKYLKNIGVTLVPFSPMKMPFLNWTANYRDHRKDISIDGKIGYTGGTNLGDEYINMDKKFGFWNDSMIRITGDAVQGIEKIFASDWAFCKKGKEKITDWEPTIGKIKPLIKKNDDLVQVVSSGPNHDSPMHLDLLLNLVSSAQKRIWLSSPYFVPPVELVKAIGSAAKSGIDVRLVLPGMTDKFLLLDVSKRWTDELYESGVKIYTMNNTFNHTKAYIFDDEISFIGSTNLDYRAFFSDQQTMLLIKSMEFNSDLTLRFEEDFNISYLYNFKPSQEHNWFVRFVVNTFNIISPLL